MLHLNEYLKFWILALCLPKCAYKKLNSSSYYQGPHELPLHNQSFAWQLLCADPSHCMASGFCYKGTNKLRQICLANIAWNSKEKYNWVHMDPIITQWNSEWVTGPGGVVFLMQKQKEALCVVCPVQKHAWVTFGTRQRLAAGKSWQQSQTGVFSCRACRFVKWGRSSLLLFLHFCLSMWNVSMSVFFFRFPSHSSGKGADADLLFDTCQASLRSVCLVCVCRSVFVCWYLFSISLPLSL